MSGVCFGIGLWNFFAVREPDSAAKEPIVCWEDQLEIQYTRSGQQHLGSRAGPARLARLCSLRRDPVEYQHDKRDQTPWAPDPRVEMPKSALEVRSWRWVALAWKRTKLCACFQNEPCRSMTSSCQGAIRHAHVIAYSSIRFDRLVVHPIVYPSRLFGFLNFR